MFFYTSGPEKGNEFCCEVTASAAALALQEIRVDCSSESTAAAEFQLTLVLSRSVKKIYL